MMKQLSASVGLWAAHRWSEAPQAFTNAHRTCARFENIHTIEKCVQVSTFAGHWGASQRHVTGEK